ncbi:MAG: histidine kinase [Ilumatobacteraceae bacterium]
MKRATQTVITLFGVDVLVAVLAMMQQHGNGRPWTFLVSDFIPGAATGLAAVLIWRRRPQNRIWWLLLAASLTFWVGDFEHHSNRNVALIGFAFSRWYDVFLAWAVLGYPNGRLRGRTDRALVVFLGAITSARSTSRLFLFVPADAAGYGTSNRFLPIHDDRWWRQVEDWHARALTAGIVGMLIVIAHRWLTSSRTTRQMLSPALFAGSTLAACVFYQTQLGWNSGIGPGRDVRIYYVVWWAYGALALALSVGMVRLRRTRSAVVDVFSELGHAAPPDRLGVALGRAMGDPSLKLMPWSSAASAYLDPSGQPVDLPADRSGRAVTLIEQDGEPMAALVHDAVLLEDPGLVNAVVAAVRLTIDNDQLQAELEARLADVAASRARIVEAGDNERRRIERNLHDGAQQRLVGTALGLKLAGSRLADSPDPRVHAVLAEAATELTLAINELRDLARGIHPTMLTQFGLRAALESLVNRSPIAIELEVDLPCEPSEVVAATAYYAVSEALTNIMKYANATDVAVRVRGDRQTIVVEVVDNGVGGATLGGGSGLTGIADRIATVGGMFRIDSPVGCGTRFEVELPCGSS